MVTHKFPCPTQELHLSFNMVEAPETRAQNDFKRDFHNFYRETISS